MSKFVLTAQLQLQAPTNTQEVINRLKRQLEGLQVPIKVTGSTQAAKQIGQVKKQTQEAATAADKMGKAFGASIKRFAAFNIATRAVGLLASKLSQAVDEAIAFQRQLIKISQVTGKTTGELSGLVQEITDLSTALGVSSTSLLNTTRILAQAGIQAGDLKVALEALAKTTLAPTFDNITQTAEGAVAILAQFGQGVGALEQQLGAINAVAGQFAVESGDLISVVRRAGGVFKQAGGSLNELLALFTSVRATTRENAESIATGLRTIFTRIQRPQTIEYLQQFGVNLLDLEGKFVGPYKAVEQLHRALSGLEEGDIRFVEIAEQLGGFRQIGKVIPLIQQFDLAERSRQAALEGGNSLNEDAAVAQQALAVQIEKTREKFLALIRSISETSTFRIMIQSLLGIAEAFIKVADAIKPILPLIATFAAFKLAKGIGGFASGIGAGLRGKNQGGKIHAFASGGSVPGTGNRDTVPAMLTPGEFVIRKSSVKKIGAGTLAAMNENKYGDGGNVTKRITAFGTKDIQSLVLRGTKGPRKYSKTEFNKERHQFTENDTVTGNIIHKPITPRESSVENFIARGKEGKTEFAKENFDPKNLKRNNSPALQGDAFEEYLRYTKTLGGKHSEFGGSSALDGKYQGQLAEVKRTKVSDALILEKTLRHELEHGAKLSGQQLHGGLGADEGDSIGVPNVFEFTLSDTWKNQQKPKRKKAFFGGSIRHYTNGNEVEPLTSKENAERKSLGTKLGDKAKKTTQADRDRFNALNTRFKGSGALKEKEVDSNRSYGAVYLEKVTSPKGGKSSITFGKTTGEKGSKGKEPVKVNYDLNHAFLDPQDGKKIKDEFVTPKALSAINSTAGYLAGLIGESIANSDNVPNLQAITGSIFEAGLARVSKEKLDIEGDDKRTFDFAGGLKGAAKIFGADGSKLRDIKTDAKVASTSSAVDSIRKKVKQDLEGSRKVLGFAKGGSIPSSDTVPAMLTPGEFVINKKSSQSIGYANLNRMNKQGAVGFANGGPVGLFDSDYIGGGRKDKSSILASILQKGSVAAAIWGPAGSGKSTLARSRYGSNLIESPEDVDKYDSFAVLSGSGATKKGSKVGKAATRFSEEAAKSFAAAAKIIAVLPNNLELANRRRKRVNSDVPSGDKRSKKQLIGTKYSPGTNYSLAAELKRFGKPVEIIGGDSKKSKKMAEGGLVGFAGGGGVKGSKKGKSKSERKYGKIILNSSGSSVSASYADGGPATGEVWAKKSYDSDEDINFFPDDNPDFVPRSATSDPSLYIVASSMATKGYGPRLYDAVMEKVTERGGKLTSDRSSVSDDAHRVWKHYFTKRPDVRKTPLKPGDWYSGRLFDQKKFASADPKTWPPHSDLSWALLTGYSKSPSIIKDSTKVQQTAHRQELMMAKGGSVPGTGNRDTIPAMLTPGEFVIRKSSVSKIGADTLAAMNDNGYAKGGGAKKGKPKAKSKFIEKSPYIKMNMKHPKPAKDGDDWEATFFGKKNAPDEIARAKKLLYMEGYFDLENEFGLHITETDALAIPNLKGKGYGSGAYKNLHDWTRKNQMGLFSGNMVSTDAAKVWNGLKKHYGMDIVQTADDVTERDMDATGNKRLVTQKGDSIFGSYYAQGGSVGTDTVPAMLTPGEFVVNKKASQSIGYGNLNKMNKQGVVGFASGGAVGGVQYFTEGGDVEAQQGSLGFETLALQLQNLNVGMHLLIESTNLLAKINLEAMNSSVAKDELTNELSEVEEGLQELKDAVKENTAAEEGSSGGSDGGGAGGGTKKDKKKAGRDGFQAMFALSTAAPLAASALDMLSEKVGGATTAMGQFSGMLASTINTVIGVGFTMTAFGLSFASVGKFLVGFTAAGKAAVTAQLGAAAMTKYAAGVALTAAETEAMILATNTPAALLAGSVDELKAVVGEQAAAADVKKTAAAGVLVAGLVSIVVGTALVVMAFRSAANAFIEKQKEIKELSIKEGDADKAGKAEEAIIRREEKSTGQTVGGTAAGVAGGVAGGIYLGAGAASKIGAVLGTAIAPGVGTVVGAAIGAVGGALVGVFAGGWIAEDINKSLSPLEQAAVHGARASAFASKATLEMARSAEKATEKLEDFESGKGDISSLFSDFGRQSVAASQGIEEGREERKDLKQARDDTLGGSALGGWMFGEDLDEIDKKLKESKAKEVKIYEEMAKASDKNYQAGQRSAAAAGQTFDQFMQTVKDGNEPYADLLKGNVVEHEKRRKAYDKLQKVMEENRKVLQSLTFGLGEFASKAQATAAAMARTADTFGENEFEAAFETLSLAFTNAAISMNAKDIETSITSADDQLEAFGADKQTREKFRGQAEGVSFLQSQGKKIFEDAKREAMGGNGSLAGPEGVKTYKEAAIERVKNSGLAGPAQEALIDQIGSLDPDTLRDAINSGDSTAIANALSGPLKEQLQKDLEEFGKSAAEVQKQLRSAYQMQIKAQNEYTDALRKNIKVQGEVLDLFEEFGGPKVTNQQRVDLLNKDLGAATNRNVGTGSPADLRKIVGDSFRSSANIRQRQQQSLRDTGVASAGMTTREMVSSERRLSTDDERQEEVISYARERIDLIREEIRIQKEKNKLEKSSLDALLSGDIEGFFKQQAAVGAQAALKSGNQGLVSNFGATAVGAGFQDLAQQEGVDAATKRRAAGMALNQFGITDQGAADVLAEQTPEIRALNAEAQEFAKVMSEASIALTQMERNELVITAQQVNLIEKKAGKAADLRTGTTNTTANLYRGGPVYANRGMFVPRGTDTVPAMLTPGEFVVNRASVQRGNNLAVLKAMNGNQQAAGPAMAQGGQVQYRQFGGIIDAIGKTFESALPNLQNVFSGFTSAVEKLTGMQIGVKLDASTVTVNIASNVLQQLPELIQGHVYKEIVRQLPKIQHSPNGGHKLDSVG